ncbi:anthranilate/aminodeoxychorismate synthase component II [Candidatus Poribacteria bacterium]|nr:anthranilate/aminodeoxychorismate synthase component II [Candidatus Poribacteria bacterium]
MIVMIDNYDSFTYNLVQYMGEIIMDIKPHLDVYSEMVVFRNDKITVDEIDDLSPDKVVISPGPCTPLEAGISNDVINHFAGKIPLLGVCLGHQCIGHVFGGDVVRADRLMHGKTSMIYHDGMKIFHRLENPFEATRYHSLIIKPSTLPDCLTVNAWTDQDEIMGVRHKEYPLWGVQFHPESILTGEGKKLLKNFIEI